MPDAVTTTGATEFVIPPHWFVLPNIIYYANTTVPIEIEVEDKTEEIEIEDEIIEINI